MRSDNLKNHIEVHNIKRKFDDEASQFVAHQPSAWEKRSLPSSVTSNPEISVVPATKNPKVEAMKKNPRVQALLEAVINDSSDHVERYIPFNESVAKIPSYTAPPLKETIIEVEKPVMIPDYTVKGVEKPFADESDSEDETSIDISDIPPPPPDTTTKFLPETVTGLRARFEELLKKLTIKRKSGEKEKTSERNEIVFLLDELKRNGAISQRMYKQYNQFLADSPPDMAVRDADSGDDEDVTEDDDQEEEEDEMKKVIKDVFDHIIQHDKQELIELSVELCREIGEEEVSLLISLVNQFFDYDGVELLPLIEEQRRALDKSKATPSTLLRIKILLDDIDSNRRRIQEIFQRIDDANENEEDIWKMLVREGLISDEQFEELKHLENTEIEEISNILKSTKIGQGIPFLPTSLEGLRDMFEKLWTDGVKNKILPIINELLRRGGMTEDQHHIIANKL